MSRARDETRDRLRWESVEDQPSRLPLFGAGDERIRHPEFRDLEFVHVRAKSIVNTVHPAARLPFRHSINVYRGCSHACSYCFARPTHEYLNLDAGRDFERVIVVKVNAVELLRAELHPRRWAGDLIAMGTNTDPYQRCEGRYRLTRGVIEILADHANPFSILTKSALVTRDLDLLREAHRRAEISVSFSVGTLDKGVWRASEPGTSHPQRRLEALAALSEVGIRTGVLVAPILPGISDTPEQLETVVEAALEAGASSVTPILLHLRPGVKEQFLPWLEQYRPDLLPRYRHLYRRSYAPRTERERITKIIADLVVKHGGTRRPPRTHRARRLSTPAPEPRRDTQLTLGI